MQQADCEVPYRQVLKSESEGVKLAPKSHWQALEGHTGFRDGVALVRSPVSCSHFRNVWLRSESM